MAGSRALGPFAHPLAPIGLLLAATVAALVWANSPAAGSYDWLIHLPFGVELGGLVLRKPLVLWVNDGLMGIFFFVVGLEIKREVLMGELSSPRKAVLAVAAAIGGMALPALGYRLLVADPILERGWGIPMATDIAFALGLLALLGRGVPASLKIFLTALAIVDDIGAVLVIALFYTDAIALASLGAGLLLFAVAVAANRKGIRNSLFYFLLGSLVWLAFLKSGVHATIAALLMAFTIPTRPGIDREELAAALRASARGGPADETPAPEELRALGRAVERAQAPSLTLEHQLHPIVALAILPIFALVNAGVRIGDDFVGSLTHPVALGILAGLVLGKPLGVTGFAFVAVKTGLASLPKGVGWHHVVGAGCLAGVGFTMALFIGGLAFEDESLVAVAKVGILAASLVSAVLGLLVLRFGAGPAQGQES